MVDFTVAICTCNGEKRLPAVLDRLRSQVETEQIQWEIIVADNNSTDNTRQVVKAYQSNWPESYPIQYCFEAKQGLAFARRCAVKAAKGPLIGFLDDDNLPAPDWVAAAYRFGQANLRAGAYGGQIRGKFEVDPPEGFKRISRYFALLEGEDRYCYNEKYKHTRKKMFPPGAGIVIRKQAWLESIPEQPLLTQTSEDVEMLSYIWQNGWEIWFSPEMQIDHFIPRSRFEKEYLKHFFQENGWSRYYVRMLKYKPWQRPFVIPLYMANDLKKLLLHFMKYRRVLETDIIAAGEMELLLSLFLSPFSKKKTSLHQHNPPWAYNPSYAKL